MSQNAQARTQLLIKNKARRQQLYGAFIEEASKLYGDALVSEEADHVEISKFVGLYVMLSQIRIPSSPAVIDNAKTVIDVIAKTYSEPPKTWHDTQRNGIQELDVLCNFSEACRKDLLDRGQI